MQAMIEAKRQYYDEKMNKSAGDLIAMIASIIDQIKISK